MSIEQESRPLWLRDPFWSQLNKVEGPQVCPHTRHDAGFDAIWQHYCEVIRELDLTPAELEELRTRPV